MEGPVSEQMSDDLAAILRALGVGDHARPYSPHEVVHRDVLPAIELLNAAHATAMQIAESLGAQLDAHMMLIPVRAQGLPNVLSVKSLPAQHPLAGRTCPGCGEPIVGDPSVALVYVGPGPEEDNQRKARDGRWHTGAAVAVHAACAGKEQASVHA
jgi:hypothetical protein